MTVTAQVSVSSSSGPGSSTSTGSSVSTSLTTTTTQAQSGVRSSSATISTGAIVGAAIGGAAGLLLILFFLWRLCRQSAELKRSNEIIESTQTSAPRSLHGVTPFTQTTSHLAPGPVLPVPTIYTYDEHQASPLRGYTVRGGTSREKSSLRGRPPSAYSQPHAATIAANNLSYPEGLQAEALPSQARPHPNPHALDQSSRSHHSDDGGPLSLDHHTYTRDASAPPSYFHS